MSDADESTTGRAPKERPQLAERVAVQPSGARISDSTSVPQRTRYSNGTHPGYDALVNAAESTVRVYPPAEAIDLVGETCVRFVDVRDAVELSEGTVPGAIHASRGRLEAHLDPANPRYVSELNDAAEIIFYCAGGGRSALAGQRAQELGFDCVGHLAGGFSAWKDAGGPVQVTEDR